MPRSCSSDLRARVIVAVEEGASRREAAERFAISASSAVKWLRSWRDEGRGTAKPRGGSRSPLDERAEEIRALVREQPDRTLDELTAALRKRRIPGSRSGLWRFLERHRISFKKKPARCRATAGGRRPGAPALDLAPAAARFLKPGLH